jgi:HEAT repeats/PBS lyase HEAT-like repeat
MPAKVKKRRWIAVLALVAVVAVVLVMTGRAPKEPVYRGKPVSYWTRLSRHAIQDDSVRVVRAIGPAAVPCLTNQLRLRDSPLKKALLWLWPKLPRAIARHFPPPVKASVLRAGAAWDLVELGPAAKEAVPTLIKALNDDDLYVRLDAAAAFGRIGRDAAPAVPALAKALSDQHGGVRYNAALSLGRLGPLAKAALPALIGCLHDQDADVRREAKAALKRIDPAAAAKAGSK